LSIYKLTMKTIVYIILLGIVLSPLYSQNKKENHFEDIYIYVKNDHFIGDALGYKAYFGLKNKDERFMADVYHFKIDYKSLDYQSLYSLGKPININSIDYITPIEYFKDKSNCDLHTELSLYKRIFIITDIPKNKLKKQKGKMKKHIIWQATYAGSIKDIVYTNMTGKILLED